MLIRTRLGLAAASLTLLGCHESSEHVPSRIEPVALRSPMRVELSPKAHLPLRVRDVATGVGAAVRLVGAAETNPVEVAGGVRFASAYGGRFDVEQHHVPGGVEDFIRFGMRPKVRAVDYEITLDDGVAGLRLVSNALELLDAGGAPRLHMEPPWIAGDDHLRHDVTVSVEGCRVDVDPSAPWTRKPIAPGARTCVVHLAWGDEITYPATLDPTWAAASQMINARAVHTATTLPTGDVLFVGGCETASVMNATAEIYGATSGTFAVTGSLQTGRAYHTATALLDGRVLVTGGIASGGTCRDSTGISTAEIWHAGSWTSNISIQVPRAWHAATLLRDGRVLIAGGHDGNESLLYRSSALFDPATNTFVPTNGDMRFSRYAFGVATLRDGRALAVAGFGVGQVDVFDPATGLWTAGPNIPASMNSNRVATLASGKVLTVGGRSTDYVGEFDPVTNVWSARPPLSTVLWDIALVPTPTGGLLAIGGSGGSTNVELFPDQGGKVAHPSLAIGRSFAAAAGVGVPMKRAIVSGGYATDASPLKSAEVTVLGLGPGQTCTTDSDCGFDLRCIGSSCTQSVPDASITYADAAPYETAADAAFDVDGGADTQADASGGSIDAATTDTSTIADTAVADTSTIPDSTVVEPADPRVTPLVDGYAQPCASPSDCASGFCVDGVCCDSACVDRCHSCALPQAPGKCMLQPIGYDLRGECEADRPCYATCGPGGECIASFAGARCAEQSCNGPSTGKGAAVCSGDRGVCLREGAIDFACAPYSCEPAFGACNTQCSNSTQCAEGSTCDVPTARCVAAPPGEDDGGCAISDVGRAKQGGALCTLSLLALGVVRRRRRSACVDD